MSKKVDYEQRDFDIMVRNVYNQLCLLHRENRNIREPQWHDITPLAENVGGFDDKVHVAYISETTLLELGYIERNPHNKNVKLTSLGLQNCDKGIHISPSDIQRLKRLLGME